MTRTVLDPTSEERCFDAEEVGRGEDDDGDKGGKDIDSSDVRELQEEEQGRGEADRETHVVDGGETNDVSGEAEKLEEGDWTEWKAGQSG